MSALIPSLVPSFIVEPVLRQARRFSRGSFAGPAAPPAEHPPAAVRPAPSQTDDEAQADLPQRSSSTVAAGQQLDPEGVDVNGVASAHQHRDHYDHAGGLLSANSGLDLTNRGLVSGRPSSPSRDRAVLASSPTTLLSLTQQPSLSPARTIPSHSLTRAVRPATVRGVPRQTPSQRVADAANIPASIRSESGSAVGSPAAEATTRACDMAAAEGQSSAAEDVAAVISSPSGEFETADATMPLEYLRPEALPEDDGMGALRARILEVQARPIPLQEKAQLMHGLLMEGYERTRRRSSSHLAGRPCTPGGSGDAPSTVLYEQPLAQGPLESFKFWQLSLGEPSTPPRFLLTEDDLRPTHTPARRHHSSSIAGGSIFGEHRRRQQEQQQERQERHLGCQHYRRNVKLQCNTCQKWYTCRLCHDDAEDHTLPRQETKNMLCMLCGYAQKASDECVRCGRLAARYYCGICKLWNDDPDRSTYHCNDCGICRVGAGLGKDFFHCKSCGICLAIETKDSHRCREGAMDCNCPICGEYMFTSTKSMIHMNPCRHLIHERCYEQHMLTSYKCPICSKSTRNMESLFRKWDQNIEEQPMPPEWQDARAIIYCNDCEAKSQTLYHWVGLKCSICQGYNTREVQILNAPGSSPPGAPPAVTDTGQVPMSGISAALSSAAAGPQVSEASTSQVAVGGGVSNDLAGATARAAAATATVAGGVSAHGSSGPRDIAQPRRSVSHMPGASVGGMRTTVPVLPPERFARSLSPTPIFAPNLDLDEDENGEEDGAGGNDIIDFDCWRRVRLRIAGSDGGASGAAAEEDEDEEEEDDEDDELSDEEADGLDGPGEEDDDDDDEEDDEILLFGHR